MTQISKKKSKKISSEYGLSNIDMVNLSIYIPVWLLKIILKDADEKMANKQVVIRQILSNYYMLKEIGHDTKKRKSG